MAAVKGADVLLYVNTGTETTPVWTRVAYQRNSELSREADTLESTSKDTEGGFKTFEAGMKSWSVSCEALVAFDDAGFQLLENAFNDNERLLIQLKTESGTGYEGEVVITSFPLTFDYGDLAVVSLEMQGASGLTRLTAPVTP